MPRQQSKRKLLPQLTKRQRQKAVDGYERGGCIGCGEALQSLTPFVVGWAEDPLRPMACCMRCAEELLVHVEDIGTHIPDDGAAPWVLDDRIWFEARPDRQYRFRRGWPAEGLVLEQGLIADLLVLVVRAGEDRCRLVLPAPPEIIAQCIDLSDEEIADGVPSQTLARLAAAQATDEEVAAMQKQDLENALGWMEILEKNPTAVRPPG